jgi:cytochrome c peroxidase
MKKKIAVLLCLFAFCLLSFYGIKQSTLQYPYYFPKPIYNFSKNPIDGNVIALGRILFYDPILSKNNSISCASCHSPYNAFAHTDHDLSHGINDAIGIRNAPALINLAWHNTFMWDGAITHLDMQALAPISHPKEMGEQLVNVVGKLNGSVNYKALFLKAFNDTVITGQKILLALSQFQLILISAESKYDKVQQGKKQFTEQEKNGYALFQKNCNACHREPLFSSYEFANNGLAVDTSLNDKGKWRITQNSNDSLLFKIPTLRNLSYTFPYMHDGRFKKLSQVINHYTSGIVHTKTLAKQLQTPILLNPNEKVDLISFLLTLNDSAFVFNPNYQFPKNNISTIENQKQSTTQN